MSLSDKLMDWLAIPLVERSLSQCMECGERWTDGGHSDCPECGGEIQQLETQQVPLYWGDLY